MMKFTLLDAILLFSFVGATPIKLPTRQLVVLGTTYHEYSEYGCRPIIFFYARGSNEFGNMGDASSIGVPTADGLRNAFGASKIAVQGVDYPALLVTALLPGGTDPDSASKMNALFRDAASRCPNSTIIGGGYSQGAAVCHRAIENLPQNVKNQIAGVLMYGDSQNRANGGRIPNYPREKTKIICNSGDLVCQTGNFTVADLASPAHLQYQPRVPEGVQFLTQQINTA